VHSEDIFRALGACRQHPVANLLAARKRITGTKLRATDADWTHGAGPDVRSPLVAVVLAMTGRTPALHDLEARACSCSGNGPDERAGRFRRETSRRAGGRRSGPGRDKKRDKNLRRSVQLQQLQADQL
jgi:hypothetical protein